MTPTIRSAIEADCPSIVVLIEQIAREQHQQVPDRARSQAESADRIREIVAQAVEIRDGVRPDVPAQATAQSPGEEPNRGFILRRPPAVPATPPPEVYMIGAAMFKIDAR